MNAVLWWLTVYSLSALVAQEEGPGAKRVNASGKVIDSVTGRPIPSLRLHMVCSIRTGPGGSYDAIADEQGAFTFVNVPDDVCGVSISGHRLSGEYQYHFNEAEQEKPWIIQLIPEVVISGTVVDEKGSPLWSAMVFLARNSLTMECDHKHSPSTRTQISRAASASTFHKNATDIKSRRIAIGSAPNIPCRTRCPEQHIL
jgi:hypothetical protein